MVSTKLVFAKYDACMKKSEFNRALQRTVDRWSWAKKGTKTAHDVAHLGL